MDDAISKRMDQILGQPPRLQPLDMEELSQSQIDAIERLRAIIGWSENDLPSGNMRTLCRHPTLFMSFMTAGMLFMTDATLPLRQRELAILRTCWLCGAPFPFGEHVEIGRQYGVTTEDVDRIKQGSQASGWSENDRTLLQAVEELHADAMISDATWAALSTYLDDVQLIELPMLVGHYHLAAFLQNSLRFSLNTYNPGLSAR